MNGMSRIEAQNVRGKPAVPIETRLGIIDLYNAYAEALDERRYQDWAACFTENAVYRLTTKENFDRNLPIAIIYCDGKGMIEDRAFTTVETTIAQPRTLRHFITGISVREKTESAYEVRANFLIVQTMLDRMTEIVMSGFCVDRVVESAEQGFLFEQKLCVSDTLLYPTSVVAPV
jgi:3-phenylpropionate/cinnamic acid dioxygenase small subunit